MRFRFRGSFAFAFRFVFAFRPPLGGPASISAALARTGWRDVGAADHPREFLFPFGAVEPRDGGQRPSLRDALRDAVVRRAVRGDLRQVGDAEHLEALRQPLQPAPTTSATAPPMPASTSSKISVLPGASVDASVLSASMMRDSSPPEAMRASGRTSSPGFGEM